MVCVFYCGSFRFGKNRHRSAWYFGNFSFGCLLYCGFQQWSCFRRCLNVRTLPLIQNRSGGHFLYLQKFCQMSVLLHFLCAFLLRQTAHKTYW